jgi:hypothetical protein
VQEGGRKEGPRERRSERTVDGEHVLYWTHATKEDNEGFWRCNKLCVLQSTFLCPDFRSLWTFDSSLRSLLSHASSDSYATESTLSDAVRSCTPSSTSSLTCVVPLLPPRLRNSGRTTQASSSTNEHLRRVCQCVQHVY